MYDLSWIVNLGKPYSWSLQTAFPQYSRNRKIAQSGYSLYVPNGKLSSLMNYDKIKFVSEPVRLMWGVGQ
jgi:hypothetical protein